MWFRNRVWHMVSIAASIAATIRYVKTGTKEKFNK